MKNYTHKQKCEEYTKAAKIVSNTIAHQQIRIALGNYQQNPHIIVSKGNGNIRECLSWFIATIGLVAIMSLTAYVLAG